MSPARARVLEALQQSTAGITANDLAGHLGQHANTVREHLDALVDRGLAVRAPGASRGRGRPPWQYLPSVHLREPDARVRDYATLTLAFADHLAQSSQRPGQDARAVGRAWGRQLTDGARQGSARAARKRLVSLLGEVGFDPVARPSARTILLRRCPLLDAASQHPEVVCSVHHGMIASVIEAYGGAADGVGLIPFAEPAGCVVTFNGSIAP